MSQLQFETPVPTNEVLSQFQIFQTSDIEEARNWGTRVFCENRLKCVNNSDKVNAHMYYRDLGGLGVGRMSYGGDLTIDPGTLDSFVLIQMSIKGSETLHLPKDKVLSNPGVASIINAHIPVVIHHSDATEKLIIRIDRALLEQHCQQHLGRTLSKPIEFAPVLDLNTAAGRRWMKTVCWIYDSLSSDEAAIAPLWQAQLQHTLIAMLLTCQESNYSAELCEEDRTIAPAFVRSTERYIEERAHEPITTIELAEHAGVSTRSLFSGFRRYRNTSPMHYLKEVRLRRVNQELKASNPADTTVTLVALHWGFNHLGHFTTDYKRRFGESPSQTLAR
jgi:AraC-like DNA-binding protein